MFHSPKGITSEAPKHVYIRPIAVNAAQVNKDFTNLSQLFAQHAKDMRKADVNAFSSYAAKFKQDQSRYEYLQELIRLRREPGSSAFARFTDIDEDTMYAERLAKMNSLLSDMQYHIIHMNDLIEDFLPADDGK